MQLLMIWIIITITIGILKFNSNQYIILSLIMLCITKVCNEITPTTMSFRNSVVLSILPNTIIWYLAYHCNNFLWVYPYSRYYFIGLFCLYSYILLYIAWECEL
jgi:hypothetical protein